MRILEARFHPDRKRAVFVVVANLIWRGPQGDERPLCEPAVNDAARPLVSKLLGLLGIMKPDCFDLLRALRSEIWSFVQVSTAPRTAETSISRRF